VQDAIAIALVRTAIRVFRLGMLASGGFDAVHGIRSQQQRLTLGGKVHGRVLVSSSSVD
jgi:hypothetical protein